MKDTVGKISEEFKNTPILAWAIDDYETLRLAAKAEGIDYNDYIRRYKQNSYDYYKIDSLFDNAPFKLNLGGETDKNKIITTARSTGVFNFALASGTLYAIQEYYSEILAKEQPDKFIDFGLVAGVVPPDFVTNIKIFGKTNYIFIDKEDGGKEYNLKQQKKGQAAIDDGVANAKYQYASKTKKVYQTFNKKGGKVRYVEIYTLFYYTFPGGDLNYAVRHIPAIMIAEYLESIGIKTRVYMTRFVKLTASISLKKTTKDNIELPMGNTNLGQNFSDCLLVQPILAKDYSEVIDKAAAFTISSAEYDKLYDACAHYTMNKELNRRIGVLGNPNFDQTQYWEGIDRYRNKYQQYVKLGLFEAKEVLPEAMIFYHEMTFVKHLNSFFNSLQTFFKGSVSDLLVKLDVNMFFVWWMKTSANTIKHKINLLNSSNYRKDMAAIYKDLENCKFDLENIIKVTSKTKVLGVKDTGFTTLGQYYTKFGYILLSMFHIVNDKKEITLVEYVNEITEELSTFADGEFYATPEDEIEKRLIFKDVMNEEAENL